MRKLLPAGDGDPGPDGRADVRLGPRGGHPVAAGRGLLAPARRRGPPRSGGYGEHTFLSCLPLRPAASWKTRRSPVETTATKLRQLSGSQAGQCHISKLSMLCR
jgi:hypothetical protein